MSDIEQLKLAIQEMNNNSGAAQFVTQIFQADNFQFLKLLAQILLSPDIPSKLLSNSVILISIVLRPTVFRPLTLIAQNYYTFSDQERQQIKECVVRGLMHEGHQIRQNCAYSLGLIVKIDKINEPQTISIRTPTVFDLYLINLIQNQPTPYASIGAMMAISQIIENKTYKLKAKKFKILKDVILNVSYTVLSQMESINNFVIEFKTECAKCLALALENDLFTDDLRRLESKEVFLKNVLPNSTIPNEDLHKNIFNALIQFNYLTYKQVELQTCASIFMHIYKSTIDPVASIKREDFNMSISPFARDVIRMWKKFAKFEQSQYRDSDDFEQQPISTITSMIASEMDELLFSYISTLPADDLFENNITNTISFFAFKCLERFSKVAPHVVYTHASSVYQSSIQGQNRQQIFISFVAAQIIFQIRGIPPEIVFKMLFDISHFLSSEDVSIPLCAYAAICTALKNQINVCFNTPFFNAITQSICSTVQSSNPILIKRAITAFLNLIDPYKREDGDSNLAPIFPTIVPLFMGLMNRPDISSNDELQSKIFFALFKYIAKLPMSFPIVELQNLATQVLGQLQELVNQNTGLQIRVWLSSVVSGIAFKLREDITPVAFEFMTIFITTIQEINTANANIYSLEELYAAVSALISFTGTLCQPLVKNIIDISLNSLSTQNSSLVFYACSLIYNTFGNFGPDLFDAIPPTLNALFDCLLSQNLNENSYPWILHAITTLLNVGRVPYYPLFPILNGENSHEDSLLGMYRSLADVVGPRRDELMDITTNFISFLPEFEKNSRENASNIFCELMAFFSTLMKVFGFEKIPDPSLSGSFMPPEFFVHFKDKFIEIIQIGDKLEFYDEIIAYNFLEYVRMLIMTFRSYNQVNVKMHNKCFLNYFDFVRNEDDRSIRSLASNIWSLFEQN